MGPWSGERMFALMAQLMLQSLAFTQVTNKFGRRMRDLTRDQDFWNSAYKAAEWTNRAPHRYQFEQDLKIGPSAGNLRGKGDVSFESDQAMPNVAGSQAHDGFW